MQIKSAELNFASLLQRTELRVEANGGWCNNISLKSQQLVVISNQFQDFQTFVDDFSRVETKLQIFSLFSKWFLWPWEYFEKR